MLNRATQPGTTARTAGMRAPRPPDPMQQYVTAAIKDDERRAHNIASAQALAAVPVTGPERGDLARPAGPNHNSTAGGNRPLAKYPRTSRLAGRLRSGPGTRELNLSAQSPQATSRCNQAACPIRGNRYTSNFTTEAQWASRDIRTSMGPTTGKLSLPVVGQCRRHFSDHIHHRLEALVQYVSRLSDGPVFATTTRHGRTKSASRTHPV
jgi:hypothetical protein